MAELTWNDPKMYIFIMDKYSHVDLQQTFFPAHVFVPQYAINSFHLTPIYDQDILVPTKGPGDVQTPRLGRLHRVQRSQAPGGGSSQDQVKVPPISGQCPHWNVQTTAVVSSGTKSGIGQVRVSSAHRFLISAIYMKRLRFISKAV